MEGLNKVQVHFLASSKFFVFGWEREGLGDNDGKLAENCTDGMSVVPRHIISHERAICSDLQASQNMCDILY